MRIVDISWRTRFSPGIDEQLVVYDDGTAWLVARHGRQVPASIGSFTCRPSEVDLAELAPLGAGGHTIDPTAEANQPLEHLFPVLDRITAAARANPFAVATFHARALGRSAGGGLSVALQVVGSGERAVQFQLDPAVCAVHFSRGGDPVARVDFPALQAGFVTPAAAGLGGLRRPATIEPGAYGTLVINVALPQDANALAIQVVGSLRAALPDDETPARFEARTEAVRLQPAG